MLMLLVGFADQIAAFNVFRYITFRTGGALITSALLVFMFGPMIINSLRIRQSHAPGTAVGAPVPAVRQSIERLVADYDGDSGGVRRGFELREVGGGWRIYVRPEHDDAVRARCAK